MTTRQVARMLGYTPIHLINAIHADRFPAPARNQHGFYEWSAADIEAARVGLAIDRRRKGFRPQRPERQAMAAGPSEIRSAL
jgi:hypothetical protein